MTPEEFRRLCRSRDRLADEDVEVPCSVDVLAAEAGMTRFQLIRRFHALFGITPHQFRIAVRLDRAKRLLVQDRAVTDVCMEVGFSSLGSFSDLFSRRVGASPSAFRRRARVAVLGLPPLGCFGLLGLLPRRTFREA